MHPCSCQVPTSHFLVFGLVSYPISDAIFCVFEELLRPLSNLRMQRGLRFSQLRLKSQWETFGHKRVSDGNLEMNTKAEQRNEGETTVGLKSKQEMREKVKMGGRKKNL